MHSAGYYAIGKGQAFTSPTPIQLGSRGQTWVAMCSASAVPQMR
jgi:hypothetical protein